METTPNTFDLGAILASLIVYLGYLGTQATAAQAAIAKIKPLILEPIRVKYAMTENAWLILMGVVQLIFGIVTLISLGGLITAKAALAPILLYLPIPDGAIMFGSLLLLVAGQESIYGIIKGLYATQEALEELKTAPPAVTLEAQSGSNVDVNVSRTQPTEKTDFYKDKR
jgi:hypothetical protein